MSTAIATSQQVQGDLQLQRPARALIGWMAPDEAAQWVAGPGQAIGPDHRATVLRARAAVAVRAATVDQTNVITEAPTSLTEHREALRSNVASAPYFQEGWDVAMADLSRICAIQRHVLTDDATQRVAEVDGLDLTSIAAVALPLAQPRRLAAAFNPEKQSWIFSSANPNLRIAGQFHGEVQPGVHAFGFVISVSASFIQVARYRDRYLLRDGYHRAYGFLARGIERVPVFVREYETFAEMGLPSGLSPQDTYLGERPPLVADYLDDAVSAAAVMPVTQKVVVVQGLEVATLG
jgi:hypothetical protein